MENKLFLSYSHKDGRVAKALQTAMEGLGISSFDPQMIAPGADLKESIRTAIHDAPAMVVVASPASITSSAWQAYEMGVASALDKPVFVVATGRLSDYPAANLADTQLIPLNPSDIHGAAVQISKALGSDAD